MGRQGSASSRLAYGVCLALLIGMAGLTVAVMRRSKPVAPKVIIGDSDEVYYSHAATSEDAATLGHALQSMGYFRNRGSAVLLSRNKGGTVVSFVLADGLWNNAAAVTSFEEIGRRIAVVTGGFPLEMNLVDAAWKIQKALEIGKTRVGSRDEIYYLGSATKDDAEALGRALRVAGYLQDLGVSVTASKGEGTAIGFVVGEGVWQQPEAVVRFANLARQVAPSIGGLPIQVRLLSPEMEIKAEVSVR